MANSINFSINAPSTVAQPVRQALDDLPRLAQLASNDTGWQIAGTIPVRVVSPDQVSSLIRDEVKNLVSPGFSSADWQKVEPILESKLGDSKALVKDVLGIHLRSTNELIVVDDPANRRLTSDSYKSTIYHELVHVAQFQNHPEYFSSVQQLSQDSYKAALTYGKDSKETQSVVDKVNSLMALVEGQPTHLQRINDSKYFPDKKVIGGARKLIGSLGVLCSSAGRKKTMQYVKGALFFDTHEVKAPLVDRYFDPRFAEREFG